MMIRFGMQKSLGILPRAFIGFRITQMTAIGMKLGLVDALYKVRRPVTVDELAVMTSTSPAALKAWCDYSAELGLIRRHGHRFSISQKMYHELVSQGGHANYLMSTGPDFVSYRNAIASGRTITHLERNEEYLSELAFASTPTYRYVFDRIFPRYDLRALLIAGSSAVELGFGGGHGLVMFANQFPQAKLSGVDISPQAFEIAGRRLTGSNLDKRVALLKPGELRESQDLIYSVMSFHEFDNKSAAISHYLGLLTTKGRLLIVDATNPSDARPREIRLIMGGVNFDEQMQNTPFLTKNDMRSIFKDAGVVNWIEIDTSAYPAVHAYLIKK